MKVGDPGGGREGKKRRGKKLRISLALALSLHNKQIIHSTTEKDVRLSQNQDRPAQPMSEGPLAKNVCDDVTDRFKGHTRSHVVV